MSKNLKLVTLDALKHFKNKMQTNFNNTLNSYFNKITGDTFEGKVRFKKGVHYGMPLPQAGEEGQILFEDFDGTFDLDISAPSFVENGVPLSQKYALNTGSAFFFVPVLGSNNAEYTSNLKFTDILEAHNQGKEIIFLFQDMYYVPLWYITENIAVGSKNLGKSFLVITIDDKNVVKVNQTDLSDIVEKNLVLSKSSFKSFTTIDSEEQKLLDLGYSYVSDISIFGVTANMIPKIVFSLGDIDQSGIKIANQINCVEGGIRIYADGIPKVDITILTAEFKRC